MVRVTSLLIIAASALGLSFGVRAQIEMEIHKCMVRCRHAYAKSSLKLGVKGDRIHVKFSFNSGLPHIMYYFPVSTRRNIYEYHCSDV